MRSGYTLFPLSIRNSAAATTFLLKDANVSHLFISSDRSMQNLAEAAMKGLSSDISVKTHPMPVFEDLFPAGNSEEVSEPCADINMHDTAMILHSSGIQLNA